MAVKSPINHPSPCHLKCIYHVHLCSVVLSVQVCAPGLTCPNRRGLATSHPELHACVHNSDPQLGHAQVKPWCVTSQ